MIVAWLSTATNPNTGSSSYDWFLLTTSAPRQKHAARSRDRLTYTSIGRASAKYCRGFLRGDRQQEPVHIGILLRAQPVGVAPEFSGV